MRLSPFLELVRIDLQLQLRSRVGMFWTIAFPALMLVMQMSLFGGRVSLGPVDVGLLDLDRTVASRTFTQYVARALEAQATIKVNTLMLAEGSQPRPKVVLTIPSGFSERVTAGLMARVTLDVDVPDRTLRSALLGLLRGLNDSYNLDARQDPRLVALTVRESQHGTPGNNYLLYLVTGLAGMILLSTSLMGFAPAVVSARDDGTLQAYHLYPIRTGKILLSWWMSRLLLSLAASALMFVAARILYGLVIHAPWPNVLAAFVLLSVGIGAFLSIGILISTISGSLPTAIVISNLLYFPLLFSGNVFVPLGGLPESVRGALGYSPLNSLVDAMRALLSGNAEPAKLAYAFGVLVSIAAASLLLSARRFRWKPNY